MIGKLVAHYQITEKIGQGGMGEVYRATDTKLNRARRGVFADSLFLVGLRRSFACGLPSSSLERHPK